MALGAVTTTLLFTVLMRYTASGDLESFEFEAETQSSSTESNFFFIQRKKEFIRQQADFLHLLENNFTESKTTVPKAQTTQKPPKTNVLLITAHRSGSTFLGELFNQNNDAFYMFEPLAAIQGPHSTDQCDGLVPEKNAYLASLLNCTFPVIYRGVGNKLHFGFETYKLHFFTEISCISAKLILMKNSKY